MQNSQGQIPALASSQMSLKRFIMFFARQLLVASMTTLAIPCLITAFLSKSRAVFYTGMAVIPKPWLGCRTIRTWRARIRLS